MTFPTLCRLLFYSQHHLPCHPAQSAFARGDNVFLITRIRLNRIGRRLEGNIGEYCGGERVQLDGDMKGNRTMGKLSVAIVQYNLNYQR